MNAERHRELAQTLRAVLDEVIPDEDERQALAGQLDEAIALGGQAGDRRLTDVLGARAETRAWMRAHDDPETDRFVGLAGGATAIGTEFVCPVCDFGFMRENAWDAVPACPNGHGALLPEAD